MIDPMAAGGEGDGGGGGGSGGGAGKDALFVELWKACAGPLASVPPLGEKVYYFPQGHIEQVEASTDQVTEQQGTPLYNLPWKIPCKVMNTELKAEQDTDEVYAQLTLLPDKKVEENAFTTEGTEEEVALPATNDQIRIHAFCKKLTASDTSTHGGFSVLRRHADECLPPLDMSQHPPNQELVAKDLHGVEWRFRHIFRGSYKIRNRKQLVNRETEKDKFKEVIDEDQIIEGQPQRHLLQSGWSVFVSAKRLVAGDAFIFLRGENGVLRVGVQRALRHQTTVPSSVISSYSMHLGVLATAWHAVNTGSMFTIYYKPRTSPAQFVVSRDCYHESLKQNYSIGMRFKMRFEGEEAAEQKFTGTIVGIGASDPAGWADSKWRSLKVRWDEASSVPRPERVSPWQIEPAVTPPPVNPHSAVGTKRTRLNVNALSVDSPAVNREVASKAAPDSQQTCIPKPLHNQGITPSTSRFGKSSDLRIAQDLALWSSGIDQDRNCVVTQTKLSLDGLMQTRTPKGYNEMLSGFQPARDVHNPLCVSSFISGNPANIWDITNGHYPVLQANHNMLPGTWSFMPHNTGLGMSQHNYHTMPDTAFPHRTGNGRINGNGAFTSLQGRDQNSGWCGNIESSSYIDHSPLTLIKPQTLVIDNDVQKTKSPRLFGYPLHGPAKSEPLVSPASVANDGKLQISPLAKENQLDVIEMDNCADHSGMENTQPRPEATQNIQNKVQNGSTRSCKKVHKQGSALGRSVDLTKFTCYDELVTELDQMFDFDGELSSPQKNWLVMYTDTDGDMMLVGDDPWNEFCNMVHKIFIYTREEIKRMNPGALSSLSENSLSNSLARGVASKELHGGPPTSSLNSEKC